MRFNLKQSRQERNAFYRMVDACDELSHQQKRQLKRATRFNRKAREKAETMLNEAIEEDPSKLGEGFDWEKAKEFWVAIIKAIFEGIFSVL